MSEQDTKTLKAILAVLTVAESNFPSDTDIRIEAIGKNTASIKIPVHLLKRYIFITNE